jgi:hypothetical protein
VARNPRTGLPYPRAYPGESEDKRAARLFLYKLATTAPRCGHAITLAGTEPYAEVELMKSYLGWAGTKTWFVDWARDLQTRPRVLAALDEIKRQWPTANVVRGDINVVMEEIPLVGFANLDFMGFDRESVMPCVRKTIRRLAPGGVMGVTWYRGREIDDPIRSAWDVLEAARDVPLANDRRWAGVLRLVKRWSREEGVRLELVGALEYQHKNAPMSVTAWRRSWQ